MTRRLRYDTLVQMAAAKTWSGALLREQRVNKGWSQDELAWAVRTSQRNIARWEKNDNIPGANNVAALAHALGVDLGDFYENGRAA